MEPIHIETVVQTDGELHISDLPFHKGDRVEAIIFFTRYNGRSRTT